MKIVLLINELDIRGGTHKQLLRLCEYLHNQRIEFLIITKVFEPDRTYPDFSKYNVVSVYNKDEFDRLNQLYTGTKKFIVQIRRIIGHFKILNMIPKDVDIINIHDLGFNPTIRLISLFRKAKIVWQINDLPINFRVGNASGQLQTSADKRICESYIKTAKVVDQITVNVTKNKELIKSCLNQDAEVLYCGVDVNSNLKKHEYSIMNRRIHVLSTGVFFPYRNYESLVCAIENVKERGYNISLDIIGATENNPKYADEIRNLIIEKKLQQSIKIWGQVNESTYDELFNKADVFVFININQSWGLAVFEGMSCGLPVIVSDSVGAIELLKNEVDSIIIDPLDIKGIADVIIKLSEDKEFYNKISDNASKAVLDFTWDKMYSQRLVNLFYKLLR